MSEENVTTPATGSTAKAPAQRKGPAKFDVSSAIANGVVSRVIDGVLYEWPVVADKRDAFEAELDERLKRRDEIRAAADTESGLGEFLDQATQKGMDVEPEQSVSGVQQKKRKKEWHDRCRAWARKPGNWDGQVGDIGSLPQRLKDLYAARTGDREPVFN